MGIQTGGDMAQAIEALREVIADMDRRREHFTVLSAPAEAELRHYFHDILAAQLPLLRAAHQQSDWAQLKRLGHTWKGAGGGVGYPEVSVWGEALEERAAANDATGSGRLIEALAVWQAREREGAP